VLAGVLCKHDMRVASFFDLAAVPRHPHALECQLATLPKYAENGFMDTVDELLPEVIE